MIETCGNCKYGKPIPSDLSKRMCWGHGVTPVVVGMTAKGPVFASQRGVVETTDDACAVWKPKFAMVDTSLPALSTGG